MRYIACISVIGLGSGIAACADSQQGPSGPKMNITVAPLTLPGIAYACYDLEVTNESGQTVWSQGDPGTAEGAYPSICSDQFGNTEGGDITYIGTCDADDDSNSDEAFTNTVTIWVDGLYDADGEDITQYQNPCGTQGCSLEVDCVENADVLVPFSFTIMRDANQGFFDIAVNFEDVFCSSKFDTCYEGNEPINLLFNDKGDRVRTGVLGLACSAGADTDGNDVNTALYMGKVKVSCASTGESFSVIPTAGPGKASVTGSLGTILHYATYWGTEDLDCGFDADDEPLSCNKVYWNIAFNLADLPTDCTLTTEATATGNGTEIVNFGLPGIGTSYPVIAYDVGLTDKVGPTCVQNPLNGEGSHVKTEYATTADVQPSRDMAAMCYKYAKGTAGPINAALTFDFYTKETARDLGLIRERLAAIKFANFGLDLAALCPGRTDSILSYYQMIKSDKAILSVAYDANGILREQARDANFEIWGKNANGIYTQLVAATKLGTLEKGQWIASEGDAGYSAVIIGLTTSKALVKPVDKNGTFNITLN